MLKVDRSWRHTIAVVAWVLNYYLLFWVWDTTVMKDEKGRYHPVEELGPEFYVLSAVLLLACFGSMFLMRYQSSEMRWGARIFFCLLPAAAGLYIMGTALGFT